MKCDPVHEMKRARHTFVRPLNSKGQINLWMTEISPREQRIKTQVIISRITRIFSQVMKSPWIKWNTNLLILIIYLNVWESIHSMHIIHDFFSGFRLVCAHLPVTMGCKYMTWQTDIRENILHARTGPYWLTVTSRRANEIYAENNKIKHVRQHWYYKRHFSRWNCSVTKTMYI